MYEESAGNGWMDGEPGRRRVMILELDIQYIKQSYMKNFSSICQRMQEKSAENCISSILSPKRDITPTKIDAH